MKENIKYRIFEIIEKGEKGDIPSLIFDYSILFLIVLNVLAVILESVKSIREIYYNFFRTFELISVVIFSVEYLLRLWTAEYKIKTRSKIIAKIRYIFTPMAIIDLLAIIPFYLPVLIPIDLRSIRILRMIRLLRLLKVQRYSKSINLVGKVLKEKSGELLVTLFITFLLLVFAASLMYYIESDAQPDQFPDIVSAFWWAIATLTTIGYGDVYPVTPLGKFLSAIIALLGIGLVALPTGILSTGFVEELEKTRQADKKEKKEGKKLYCPYCGHKLDE